MDAGGVIALIKALGGGGGSSGGGVLVVHIENQGSGVYIPDKTYNEVLTAYQSGVVCFFSLGGSSCVVTKDEEYPELYGNIITVAQVVGGGGMLSNRYIEFTSEGMSVVEDTYSLTSAE